MPRPTRKPTSKEVRAIRLRAKTLVSREIGKATIVKDKMKEREFSFIYPIDDFRSLAFKITVSPVMNQTIGYMAALHINPGTPP